jgi:hypothetical protein
MSMLRSITDRTLLVVSLIVTFAVLLNACSINEFDGPSEKVLAALLAEKATRERIELALGKGYAWSEIGSAGWNSSYRTSPERVREATKRYSKLMHYTTASQRTWLFLDENDVLGAYFIGSQ